MILIRSVQNAFLLLLLVFLANTKVEAQYTSIGDVTFASNTFGPMVARSDSANAYSRHAYIYPEASLGRLRHGDSIRMIQFYKLGANVYLGDPSFRIYIGMSDSSDFGFSNIKSWTSELKANGVMKVFDNTISSIVDASEGYKSFPFDSVFLFDTTKGKNLKIMVEFEQNQIQNAGIPTWGYENDNSVAGFVSNNESKYDYNPSSLLTDSTRFTNVRKPSIRLFHQKYDVNAEVTKIYCLGELALLMNPIDTIKFLVDGTGLKTGFNKGFEVRVSGANTYRDTVFADTLKLFDSQMLYSTKYKPSKTGIDTITIRPIGDDYILDDTSVLVRRISTNILSQNNPLIPNAPFGVGFSGSNGDFVAKYYTDSNFINQVKIGFLTNTQERFNVGIWEEDSNGAPGKLLYISDTLLTVNGQYIQPILPKVQVKNGYFVGIRQLDNTNVGFQYESEVPIRNDIFYFTSPPGNTNWTVFSSPATDFNVDIQPRIQVNNDVSVLSILNPNDLDTFEFDINKSFYPKALVYNYGARDQKAPFDLVCEARDRFNNVVYSSTEIITINSEDSLEVTFKDSFSLGNYGDIRMMVYPKLAVEEAKENDTASVDFSIYVSYDVQVESFFDPVNGNQYEFNKDRVGPTVRIVNFGSKDQDNIRVTSRMVKDGQYAREQTKSLSLIGGGSQIMSFDSVTIPFAGDVTFEVFCFNTIDSFPTNDTARVTVEVVRSNDMGVVSIFRPRDSSIFNRNEVFRPYVTFRNFGLGDQDSVVLTSTISQLDGTVLYRDTLSRAIPKLSTIQLLFKDFKAPDSAQTLVFETKSWIAGDQDSTNDSLSSEFFIRTKTDLAATQILSPTSDSLYLLGDSMTPNVQITNTGNSPIASGATIKCRITNSNGVMQYFDSVDANNGFQLEENKRFDFKSFKPLNRDKYTTVFFIDFPSDGERSNDTISNRFEAALRNSIKINAVALPEVEQVYQLNKDTMKFDYSIVNDGLNDIVSPVFVSVILEESGQQVYQHLDTIFNLTSEDISNRTAPDYIPLQTGTYELTINISNAEDQQINDNERSFNVFVSLANDVLPVKLVSPQNDSLVFANRVYAPKGEVKNIGDSSQLIEFSTSYIIEFGGTQVYNSNKNITLESGSTSLVVFDSVFNPKTPGIYDMMLITRLGSDQVKTNDTLTGSFEVDFNSSIKDLSILGIEVYPNPATDVISISSKNIDVKTAALYDVSGRLLTAKEFNNNEAQELNLEKITPQTGWLKIDTEYGVYWTKILILK